MISTRADLQLRNETLSFVRVVTRSLPTVAQQGVMIGNLKSTHSEINSTERDEDEPDGQGSTPDKAAVNVHSSYVAAYDRDIILRLAVVSDALPYKLQRCGLAVQAAVNRQTVISELCRAGLYEDETELVRPANNEVDRLTMSEKLLDAGHGLERAVCAFYNQAITTDFTFWTKQYAPPTA